MRIKSLQIQSVRLQLLCKRVAISTIQMNAQIHAAAAPVSEFALLVRFYQLTQKLRGANRRMPIMHLSYCTEEDSAVHE
jgi:hypothetical protein